MAGKTIIVVTVTILFTILLEIAIFFALLYLHQIQTKKLYSKDNLEIFYSENGDFKIVLKEKNMSSTHLITDYYESIKIKEVIVENGDITIKLLNKNVIDYDIIKIINGVSSFEISAPH